MDEKLQQTMTLTVKRLDQYQQVCLPYSLSVILYFILSSAAQNAFKNYKRDEAWLLRKHNPHHKYKKAFQ